MVVFLPTRHPLPWSALYALWCLLICPYSMWEAITHILSWLSPSFAATVMSHTHSGASQSRKWQECRATEKTTEDNRTGSCKHPDSSFLCAKGSPGFVTLLTSRLFICFLLFVWDLSKRRWRLVDCGIWFSEFSFIWRQTHSCHVSLPQNVIRVSRRNALPRVSVHVTTWHLVECSMAFFFFYQKGEML